MVWKKRAMKIEIILKPCPWCRKTPQISMPIDEETWCWHVMCTTKSCLMKPISPHISIRKTSKIYILRFKARMEQLAEIWNTNNPYSPYEKLIVDLTKIENKFTDTPNGDNK